MSQSSTGERFLNVIPVDSWWSFKRPVVGQVRTLEEVDAKVEEVPATCSSFLRILDVWSFVAC